MTKELKRMSFMALAVMMLAGRLRSRYVFLCVCFFFFSNIYGIILMYFY